MNNENGNHEFIGRGQPLGRKESDHKGPSLGHDCNQGPHAVGITTKSLSPPPLTNAALDSLKTISNAKDTSNIVCSIPNDGSKGDGSDLHATSTQEPLSNTWNAPGTPSNRADGPMKKPKEKDTGHSTSAVKRKLPSTKDMVGMALTRIRNAENGISYQKILRLLKLEYGESMNGLRIYHLKNYLKRGIAKGEIVKLTGRGLVGKMVFKNPMTYKIMDAPKVSKSQSTDDDPHHDNQGNVMNIQQPQYSQPCDNVPPKHILSEPHLVICEECVPKCSTAPSSKIILQGFSMPQSDGEKEIIHHAS